MDVAPAMPKQPALPDQSAVPGADATAPVAAAPEQSMELGQVTGSASVLPPVQPAAIMEAPTSAPDTVVDTGPVAGAAMEHPVAAIEAPAPAMEAPAMPKQPMLAPPEAKMEIQVTWR